MTQVSSDLVGNSRLRRDADGFEVERVYLVTGVGGDAATRLYNATIAPGIPQYGDPHPSIPELTVTEITAEPQESGSDVRVTALYSIPNEDEKNETLEDGVSEATFNISTSLVGDDTSVDINNELLTATYQTQVQRLVKYGRVDVERPQMSVTFSRIESAVPKLNINRFLGKINSQSWSAYPAKTWLCSAINVREDKGKFEVDYTFTYRPSLWRATIVYNLSEQDVNEFPIDVTTGNGYAVYDVYEAVDFNLLGFFF